MRLRLLLLLFVCLLGTVFQGSGQSTPPLGAAPGRYFVSTNGDDSWSGSLPEPNLKRTDGPFATLSRSQQALRAEKFSSAAVYVRRGTHFLTQPLVLTKEDSGAKFLAYPGERPVLSGGRAITGWKRGNDDAWVASIPEARAGQWFFGQLRVGNKLQIRARQPNYNPVGSLTNGWLYTTYDGPRPGAFGVVVSRIYNTNDWIEWTVNAPTNGQYKVAFYYSAFNRPYGYSDLAGRVTLQVNGGSPVSVTSLPDTAGPGFYRWQVVGTFSLQTGGNTIRWTNVKGGMLNLDALAFCDDPGWNPSSTVLPPTAAPYNRIVVQAESFTTAKCKEMVVPVTPPPAFTDHFMFKGSELREYPLSPEAEIHMFPGAGWVNSILQVRQIDFAAHTVYLQTNSNSSQEIRVGNRYYIDNVFEALDSPGEWYLDRNLGNLYYIPVHPAFQLDGVVAPVLDHLIEFRGNPAANQWVEQVIISGFEFSDTTYSRYINPFGPQDAAIQMSGARGCVLESNRFINLGGHAVRLENRSEKNEIVGNEIAYTGEGGVLLTGNTASQPRNNTIAGNWIHHVGQVYKHVAGVFVSTGSGNRIANNRFENLPRYAVSLKSFDTSNVSSNNLVEYNDMLSTCQETSDGAAIETLGRNQKETGNVIQYNRIMDVIGLNTSPEGKILTPYFTWGIYLDDYSSGTTVRGNLVVRNDQGGGCIHGGRNNTFENNVFVSGRSHQMRYQVRDTFCVSNQFVRNIIFYTEPQADVFSSSGTWRANVLSLSNNNLYWHASGAEFFKTKKLTPLGTFAQWQAGGFDTNSVIADPMFTDPAKDDYSLRANSPAVGLGFQPIPFDKIGLAGYARSWKR